MCVSIKYMFCAEPKGPSAMVVIYVDDVQCVFCMFVFITIDHNQFLWCKVIPFSANHQIFSIQLHKIYAKKF